MGYPLKNVKLFHWWCNKVLPLVYDDSLSYYETLCKIMNTIKDLIEVEELQNNAITDLDERMTTAEGDIDKLEERMDKAEDDIDGLTNRMVDAENDIDALEGRMDTAEGDIDALEGRMDTAEGDIDDLQDDVGGLKGRMDTAEDDIDNLETRMGDAEDDIDALEGRMNTAEDDIDNLEPIDYLAPKDKNISGEGLYKGITNGSLINGAIGTADLSLIGKQDYNGYYEYDSTSPDYGTFKTANVWETNRLALKSGLQYWIGGITAVNDMVVVCYNNSDNVVRYYTVNNSGLYIEDDSSAPSGTYKFTVQDDTAYIRAIFPWECATIEPSFVPNGWITYKGDTNIGIYTKYFNVPSTRTGMDAKYVANMFESIYKMVGAKLYNPSLTYNKGDYMFIGFTLFRADNNVSANSYYMTNFSKVNIMELIGELSTQLNGFTIHDVMTQNDYDNLGTYDTHTIYPIVG